jgi:hypothetical protein
LLFYRLFAFCIARSLVLVPGAAWERAVSLDVFAYNLDYRLFFPDDCAARRAIRTSYARRLALSPIMRRRLEKRADWFSPLLQEVLK